MCSTQIDRVGNKDSLLTGLHVTTYSEHFYLSIVPDIKRIGILLFTLGASRQSACIYK
jgi:hypothetical protein